MAHPFSGCRFLKGGEIIMLPFKYFKKFSSKNVKNDTIILKIFWLFLFLNNQPCGMKIFKSADELV